MFPTLNFVSDGPITRRVLERGAVGVVPVLGRELAPLLVRELDPKRRRLLADLPTGTFRTGRAASSGMRTVCARRCARAGGGRSGGRPPVSRREPCAGSGGEAHRSRRAARPSGSRPRCRPGTCSPEGARELPAHPVPDDPYPVGAVQ